MASRRWALPIIIIAFTAIGAGAQTQRSAAGTIYFTNNTPPNLRAFPVEILDAHHHRVSLTQPDEQHRFAFANLQPGRYVLRLTWPKRCVLSYRLDLRTQSSESIRVIMDAACAHANGKLQDLPAN